MTAAIDITGQRFGKLVAIEPAATRRGQNFWLFRCDCGTAKEVRKSHVVAGCTISCGCFSANTTHGLSHTRFWAVWKAMKQRCRNQKTSAYHRYGGRGIDYCPEWETFEGFAAWAIPAGYADDLELDRIDNDGNYCPENCQFISHRANSRKTSAVALVEYGGAKVPIIELAEQFGVAATTIKTRIRRGWTIERALIPSLIPRKQEAVKCA